MGKICLLKSYYMPILTYGAKAWTQTKADIIRLMTATCKKLRGKCHERENKYIGDAIGKFPD
jgi:hypothetical protein